MLLFSVLIKMEHSRVELIDRPLIARSLLHKFKFLRLSF